MKTKYNVGDEAIITKVITAITINENGTFYTLDNQLQVAEDDLIAKTSEKSATIVEKLEVAKASE